MRKILATLILITSSLHANETTWTGATDNDWGTAGNWSNGVPGITDTAILGDPLNQNLDVPAGAFSIDGIQVNNSSFSLDNAATFNFDGFGISNPDQTFPVTNNFDMRFNNQSSAGYAHITNNTTLRFLDDSNAYGSTIINNNILRLFDNSQATHTCIVQNAPGIIEVGFRTSTLEIGSLRGGNIVRPVGANATISVGHKGWDDNFTGRFDDNGAFTLSFIKTGPGTFSNNNTMHSYTGDTRVMEGTLQWDGGHAGAGGDFFIYPGATLSGTGNVPGTTLNDGHIRPGTPDDCFGQLNIITYDPNSTGSLDLYVSPTTSSSLRVNTGMNLTNTTLNLDFSKGKGRYQNVTHQIIDNAGPVFTTTFDAVNGTPPRLAVSVSPNGNDLDLNIQERPFGDVLTEFFSTTANQSERNIAAALDILIAQDFNADFSDVIGCFNTVPEGEFLIALDSIGSNHNNATPTALFYYMNQLNTIFTDGFESGDTSAWSNTVPYTFSKREGVAAQSFKARPQNLITHFRPHTQKSDFHKTALQLKDQLGSAQKDHGRQMLSHNSATGHIWFQAFGNKSDAETTSEDLGFRANSAGVMMGFDYQVDSDLRLGIGGGYSHSNIDINRALGHSRIESPFANIWGQYVWDCYDIDFGLTYRRDSYDTKRYITFLAANRTARGHHHGYGIMPTFKVTRHIWTDGALHIRPFTSYGLFYTHEDAYQETNAGSMNLNIKSRNATIYQSTFGVGFDRHLCLPTGLLRPSLEVSYKHRKAWGQSKTVAAFQNTNVFFVSTANDDHRHRLGLKASVSHDWHDGAHFKISYQGDYGKGQKSHMGLFTIGKKW